MIPLRRFASSIQAWRIFAWSHRPDWGARSRLALASGVVFFFVLLAPLLEFVAHPAGKVTTGMTLAALVWLAFVVALSFRLRRFERRGRLDLQTNVQK